MEGNKETLKILKDYIDKITVRREGKNNKHSEKNEFQKELLEIEKFI